MKYFWKHEISLSLESEFTVGENMKAVLCDMESKWKYYGTLQKFT